LVGESIGPFRILQKLGAGGMGDVYLAEDTRLDRKVALKSPTDSWLEAPDAHARLHREARAAARLNHPNIAAIYDVFDIDSRPYIVIEYVEGESLSSIASRGPLPVDQAVRIVRQLATALEAAHGAGVIHRDLKPANVMITPSGIAKVLDFGLARTAESRTVASHLTEAGQILGTPDYMAPEQFVGRAADERSDLYSLGAVLYELVTGRRPFEAADPVSRVMGGLTPPPASERNPNLPPALDRLLARALALDPRERYQSASAFRQELDVILGSLTTAQTGVIPGVALGWRDRIKRARWAIAAATVAIAVIAVGTPLVKRWVASRGDANADTPAVIAVLPLENLNNDPQLQFFGAGMAEIMSTKLASVSGLSVVNRSEIHAEMQRHKEVTKLSQALGASYLVTGSVQHLGQRMQVTINVVRPDGRILYGNIYEDAIENVFALQQSIAEWLSNQLLGTLSADELRRLARAPAANVQAMTSYWRGRDLLENPSPAVIARAIAEFERATREDPQFALGHAGLGGAHWRMYLQTREPDWARRAVEATERARQLDSEEPAVRYALAVIYHGSGRNREAVAELRQMLAIHPASEEAHRLLGDIAAGEGRLAEARLEFEAAVRLRPRYWGTYRALGVAEMNAGNYTAAAEAFQRVIDLQPESPTGYQLLGTAMQQQGDPAGAVKNYEASLARGGSHATYSNLGTAYFHQHRYPEAVAAYRKAIELRPLNAQTHANIGDAYRQLQQADEAAREYRRAIELADADLGVNPRNATALSLRALAHARLGRIEDAQQDSHRAVQLSPSNADVLYRRGVILALSGQTAEALEALRISFEHGRSKALARIDDDLASLRKTREFQALVK